MKKNKTMGPFACECGNGKMRPSTLDHFDFSDAVGFEVILHGVDGYRCDACGEETLYGATINTVMNFIVVELARQPRRLNGVEAKYLRHRLDATQEELATRIGIVRETVAKWECGDATISAQHDFILRVFALGMMIEGGALPAAFATEIMGSAFVSVRSEPPKKTALGVKGGDLAKMRVVKPPAERHASL